jgi:hypothetical protein
MDNKTANNPCALEFKDGVHLQSLNLGAGSLCRDLTKHGIAHAWLTMDVSPILFVHCLKGILLGFEPLLVRNNGVILVVAFLYSSSLWHFPKHSRISVCYNALQVDE